jgi:hypothetical protein
MHGHEFFVVHGCPAMGSFRGIAGSGSLSSIFKRLNTSLLSKVFGKTSIEGRRGKSGLFNIII